MKNTCYLLFFMLFSILSSHAQNTEYYISPNGNDNNVGTLAAPFQTLERARNEIRATDHFAPVTVWLMDGHYYRNATFDLTAADSGFPAAPITYAAMNQHAAVIHFNKSIPVEDFSPVTAPALVARLTPEASGKVVQIDLAALGIQLDTWPDQFAATNQKLIRLYAGGELLPLSRYPNDTMMTMKRVLQNEPGIFEYRGDRHNRWLEAVNEGLWLQGFWRVEWQFDAIRTLAIDTEAKTVTQAIAVPGGIGSKYHRPEGSGEEHYIATNVMDEIDLPGEWSVNFQTKMLYIWIPDGVSDINIIDNDDPVVRLTDASHVNIKNIKFDYGLGSAIEINDGTNDLIAGCEMSNFMEYVVIVNNGTNHEVLSNNMHDLGSGGIYLSGGDRHTLTSANHRAVNNHIYEFATVKILYAGAIDIPAYGFDNNVGMYVAHNKIHGTSHLGVGFGGNNNLFEYNEVYDFCRVSGDMGAFYTYTDWASYGNTFRYNYVHDAPGLAHAFYLDGADGGDSFYHNIAQNVDIGIFVQGGRDVNIHNNLMVNCKRPISINSTTRQWLGTSQYERWLQRVLDVDYQNPPWSDQFPELASLPNGAFPGYPAGTSIECNVGINSPNSIPNITAATAATWGVHLGVNYLDDDASLVDASIEEIAAACAYNGQSCISLIPFNKIGLFEDEYRTISSTPIQICDDNDDCTVDDQYDADCNCVGIFKDSDNDGICDSSDACPFDPNNDADNDGVCDDVDICIGHDDNGPDADNDNIPDACDSCPDDPINDIDNDGICHNVDPCPNFNNNLIGTICDDGDPCSELSVYDANCNCVPIFNFALVGTASMSSHYFNSTVNLPRLTDGIIDNNSEMASTNGTTANEWMEIDLGASRNIDEVVIWNRTNCCSDRLNNVYVLVSNTPFPSSTDLTAALANASFTHQLEDVSLDISVPVNVSRTGRYIRLQKSGNNAGGDILNILELQIMGDTLKVDTDKDGVCDEFDAYPGFDDNIVGSICDDNDPCTALSIRDTNYDCIPVFNFALVATPSMSSHYFNPTLNFSRLTDGIIDNGSLVATNANSAYEWIELDLGVERDIKDIVIWNRISCCSELLSNAYLLASNTPFPNNTDIDAALANADFTHQLGDAAGLASVTTDLSHSARYVRLQKSGDNPGGNGLNILEFQVLGDTLQIDSDGDGVCDDVDRYPGLDDTIIGTFCDDNDPCTALSVYDTNYDCVPTFNYALAGTALMSSNYFPSTINLPRVTDGITDNNSLAHTNGTTAHEWIEIDLGRERNIEHIVIWNRTDCCSERLSNVYILASNTPFPNNTDLNAALANADFTHQLGDVAGEVTVSTNLSHTARYVRLQKSGDNPGGNRMNILELQVMSNPLQVDSDENGICDNLETQSCPLLMDLSTIHTSATFSAAATLTSSSSIPANATVIYKAEQAIQLLPGFNVALGGNFEASIAACQGADLLTDNTTRETLVDQIAAKDNQSNITVNGLHIFPNPFKNKTLIQYSLIEPAITRLEIISLNGTLVQVIQQGFQEIGNYQIDVALDYATTGIYMVQLTTATEKIHKKVVLTE